MIDPESTSEILARCIEEYQEQGDAALEKACRQYPELSDRIRSSARALRELLRAASSGGESPPGMDWIGRQTLGRFSLGDKLGQGGMGAVYEAFDPVLKRKVAIKVFPTRISHSEQLLKRFRREGEALAKTRHPHIVPVLEVGETEDQQPYLVMQFIEGSSLSAILAKLDASKQSLPESWTGADQGGYWKTVASKIADIADAVQHVHVQGVVHRDIKPGNILIDGQGQAILIDFGVARTLNEEGMTLSGTTLGTPAFMAPEQIQDPDAVGPCTDVYGLGVTLYQCLTLRLPFEAKSKEEFYDMICHRAPVAPRRIRPAIPRDLETICLTAMEKDPASRYGSAEDLRDDLRRFIEDRPIRARPLGPVMSVARWMCRNRAAAMALLLALFVVVLGPSSYALYMRSIASQERIAKEKISKESILKEKAQAMAAYSAGRLLAQRGHWTKALIEYASAKNGHPDPVLVAIGRIEALEGNLEAPAAMQELETLREQAIPERYEAKLLLLEADLDVNRIADPDAKMELVDRALAMKTLGPADTLFAKAMKADSVAEALDLLRRAHRYDPNHRRVNDSLSMLLIVSGNRRELALFSRELRAIYPDDPATSLLESFVLGLFGKEANAKEPSVLSGRPFTEAQRRMLAFVDRAARFIRENDRITRDQLFDAAFERKSKVQTATLTQIVAFAIEGSQLMKAQRSSASGNKMYFRVLPVVSRNCSDVLKTALRFAASALFSKPDPEVMIQTLDQASQKLGDAVYAHGAGMWCLMAKNLEEAEKRFELATKTPSLILSARTSFLYLVYARRSLYLKVRDKDLSLAERYRAKAMASIQSTMALGTLSPDEYRYLFECSRDIRAEALALRLALGWREKVPEAELPQRATGAALQGFLNTHKAPKTKAVEASGSKR